MRPSNLKSKIFLDGGDPQETKEVIKLLGFLDGQTTNPTLIAKNPEAKERLARGKKFSKEEIYNFYHNVVEEIAGLIPRGSVSVEVYADKNTPTKEMFEEGRKMFGWILNAHVKFPTTKEGLTAAEAAVGEGMRVNMTLCFTQEQAAAVYSATRGAKKGDIFVSPFVGRLDDRGEKGMDLIKNILKMYKGWLVPPFEALMSPQALEGSEQGEPRGHVEVLTASVRSMDHFLCAIEAGSDIITAPYKILKEWAAKGLPLPDDNFKYAPEGLKPIPYREIDLNKVWREYDIRHELTDKGIERFSNDWNGLIG